MALTAAGEMRCRLAACHLIPLAKLILQGRNRLRSSWWQLPGPGGFAHALRRISAFFPAPPRLLAPRSAPDPLLQLPERWFPRFPFPYTLSCLLAYRIPGESHLATALRFLGSALALSWREVWKDGSGSAWISSEELASHPVPSFWAGPVLTAVFLKE